jgi:precorrin-6x reductase
VIAESHRYALDVERAHARNRHVPDRLAATALVAAASSLSRAIGDEATSGRMDAEAMRSPIGGEDFDAVVDATHPHAAIVSQEIRKACTAAGVEYIRILRPEGRGSHDGAPISVPDVPVTVEFLKRTAG